MIIKALDSENQLKAYQVAQVEVQGQNLLFADFLPSGNEANNESAGWERCVLDITKHRLLLLMADSGDVLFDFKANYEDMGLAEVVSEFDAVTP